MSAFDDFFRDHRPKTLRWVTAKVDGNRYDAEDIVNDAFLDLFRQWDTVLAPEKLLTTIANRKIMRLWERRRRESPGLPDLAVLETRMPVGADPASLAVVRDDLRRLGAGLDDVERLVVAGWAREDTTAEIADDLQMTSRQVLQVQERVRQRLAPKEIGATTVDWSGRLGRLSPQQRDVMELAFLGHKPGLIAQMLGISANAARANLCLAKGALAAAAPVEEDKALAEISRYVLDVRHWAKYVPRPVKFELLIATVMTLDGMDIERAHGGAGDGGADVIGAALDGSRLAIQCKFFQHDAASVEPHSLRGVYDGWFDGAGALVATNRYLTASAMAESRARGVQVLDRDDLVRRGAWMEPYLRKIEVG